MFGHAAETTAGLPLIVVMPDAGFDGDGGGWFTDWFNGGAGSQPMWEPYHVRQPIPWIDDNFRTIAARRGRAVAGLSQGGFGSLSYAVRHPELFTSAAAP
jgi:S-formylglutathione hydrolase FrmB